MFEWEIQHIPQIDYRLANTGGTGGIGGGGGLTMILANQDVPGMGSISLFLDPDHRLVGLWKAASRLRSSGSPGELPSAIDMP